MLTQVIAKTVVCDELGNILLLVRSDDDEHRPGDYDLPGGQVDAGENYKAGAVREALEQAGLQLEPETLRLAFAAVKTTFKVSLDAEVSMVWLGFATVVPSRPPVKLSYEHKSYEWLAINEALAKVSRGNGRSLQAFLAYMIEHDILDDLEKSE